jgi:hypothetical protein
MREKESKRREDRSVSGKHLPITLDSAKTGQAYIRPRGRNTGEALSILREPTALSTRRWHACMHVCMYGPVSEGKLAKVPPPTGSARNFWLTAAGPRSGRYLRQRERTARKNAHAHEKTHPSLRRTLSDHALGVSEGGCATRGDNVSALLHQAVHAALVVLDRRDLQVL